MRAAIFNPQSLLGGELRKALVGSGLPLLDVAFVGGKDDDGTLCEYDGEPRVIHEWNVDAADGIDVLFRCDPSENDPDGTTAAVPLVVDLGLAGTAGGAQLWSTRRPSSGNSGQGNGHYVLPHPVASLVARLVQPLASLGTLRGLDVIALEPVSSHGNAGVDELHAQTVEALSFRSPPTAGLGVRIAFDVVPSRDDETEERITSELSQLLSVELDMSLTRLRVPVFFGLGLQVAVVFAGPIDPADAVAALAAADGVAVCDLPLSPGDPPADEVDDVDRVHVVVRESDVSSRLHLWAVADYLRAGLVCDALALAERWALSR